MQCLMWEHSTACLSMSLHTLWQSWPPRNQKIVSRAGLETRCLAAIQEKALVTSFPHAPSLFRQFNSATLDALFSAPLASSGRGVQETRRAFAQAACVTLYTISTFKGWVVGAGYEIKASVVCDELWRHYCRKGAEYK